MVRALGLTSFEPGDLAVVGVLVVLEGLLSLDNALVLGLLARRLPPAQQGEIQPLGNQLLADTGNRPWAGAQGRDDLLIRVFLPEGIVGQQEDAGMG